MSMNHILYFTDKFGVSQGYEPAFTKMLTRVGIRRAQVITTSIYNMVPEALKKVKVNDTIWRFNPERKDDIRRAFDTKVLAIKPRVIVVSCPAVLGILTGWDLASATLAKLRGGVYTLHYESLGDIPVIVTYPITAIHRQVDERLVTNDDGDEDTAQPYRVMQGSTILNWDWGKIGRYYLGRPNRLPKFEYSIVRSLNAAIVAKRFLESCILLSTDVETGNWPPQITCVGFTGIRADGRVHSFVFPFYDEFAPDGAFWEDESEHEQIYLIVRDILDLKAPKVMHNGSYDCSYFVRDRIPPRNFFLDTMVLWWCRFMEMPKTLDFVCSVVLDNYQYWKDDIKGDKVDEVSSRAPSMERYWRYNALDCYNTLMAGLMLLGMFKDNDSVKHNYKRAHMRLHSAFQMAMRGVKADFERREEHRVKLELARDKATAELRFMIDEPDFNINSPDQKSSLLYDVFGIKEMDARGRPLSARSKGGRSSGKIPLRMARQEHPLYRIIIDKLEEAMAPAKQVSNICDMKLYSDRFRNAYNPVGTETMRLSSKKSNFWDGTNSQNINKKMRDWLIADDDHVLLDIDYSQSDDVIMAYESQDPEKIAVVESGRDAHAVNGELFFRIDYDKIVEGKRADDPWITHPITGIRQISKRIVHGTNFQMAGFTLYVNMGRDSVVAAAEYAGFVDAELWNQEKLVKFCDAMMRVYRGRYKRLSAKEYYKEVADQLLRYRVMTNAFGDTRLFLSDPKDPATQREATAFIGQSGTGGNMNRVMEEIDWGYIPSHFRDGPNPHANETPLRMSYESHGIAFLIQVHDNFVASLNTKHPRFVEAANNLLRVMERPVIIHGREVVIKAEAELSLRWSHKTLPWNGDPAILPAIVEQLRKESK